MTVSNVSHFQVFLVFISFFSKVLLIRRIWRNGHRISLICYGGEVVSGGSRRHL